MTREGDLSGGKMSDVTSLSLIERVEAHDPAAWRRFAAIYGPIVYRWAIAWKLQPSDAADVSQEVFAAVATKLGQFRRDRPGTTFRGWLYVIAKNKATDLLRTRATQPRAMGGIAGQRQLEQYAELPDVLEDSDVGTAVDILRRVLVLAQSEFEPRTWAAFWRSTVEAHLPADVASDLGMKLASVYQSKCRVIKHLRRELAGLLP